MILTSSATREGLEELTLELLASVPTRAGGRARRRAGGARRAPHVPPGGHARLPRRAKRRGRLPRGRRRHRPAARPPRPRQRRGARPHRAAAAPDRRDPLAPGGRATTPATTSRSAACCSTWTCEGAAPRVGWRGLVAAGEAGTKLLLVTTSSAAGAVSILGHELELGEDALGELVRTQATLDPGLLRARLEQDGYLYLPGFFEREDGAGRAARARRAPRTRRGARAGLGTDRRRRAPRRRDRVRPRRSRPRGRQRAASSPALQRAR